jgi:predicted DNA-binding transcriptional regulator YafY
VRASRLLSILLALSVRGRVSAADLAAELEVSTRTIYRDIDALSAAGVPVHATRGRDGGFQLLDGYRTRLTGLTGDEAESLFFAGMPGPAAELGLGAVMTAAQLKLLAALPPELQERAERSGRLFHLDTAGWFRGEDRTPHLATLASAVWEGRRVAARYREGPKVVRRTLDPLGLVFKAGAWYLVARRSVGMRVYRVSRFASARILEQTFERPPDFELASYWAESSERFVRERPRFDARIRMRRVGLRYLRGIVHPDGRALLDEAAKGAPDELVELSVPFDQLEYAYRELLTFGGDVEVLDPPELRERLRNAAQEVLALYG